MMNESIYDKINNRITIFYDIIYFYETHTENNTINLWEKYDRNITDPYRYFFEFDQIKKENPYNFKKYLEQFLDQYLSLNKRFGRGLFNKTVKLYTVKEDMDFLLAAQCIEKIIDYLEGLLNLEYKIQETTKTKNEVQEQAQSKNTSKNEKNYDRIKGSLRQLSKIFEKMYIDRSNGVPLCEYPETKDIDQFRICTEIDQFKIKYSDTYPKYLRQLLIEYATLMFSKNEFISKFLTEYEEEILDPYGFGKLFTAIDYIVEHLKDIFKIEDVRDILNPETVIQETPPNLEKLKPIEKILIIHYLNIESLKRYQYHLKPGVFFLSRLLDINPESIKKPVLKISDYTTNKIDSESQARNLYPTLEKVKSFFDNSDLNEISKEIEIRIKELKRISGKD